MVINEVEQRRRRRLHGLSRQRKMDGASCPLAQPKAGQPHRPILDSNPKFADLPD